MVWFRAIWDKTRLCFIILVQDEQTNLKEMALEHLPKQEECKVHHFLLNAFLNDLIVYFLLFLYVCAKMSNSAVFHVLKTKIITLESCYHIFFFLNITLHLSSLQSAVQQTLVHVSISIHIGLLSILKSHPSQDT